MRSGTLRFSERSVNATPVADEMECYCRHRREEETITPTPKGERKAPSCTTSSLHPTIFYYLVL